jgi:hypothetical protein
LDEAFVVYYWVVNYDEIWMKLLWFIIGL